MMEILNFSQNATDLEVFQQENVLKVLIWLKSLSVSVMIYQIVIYEVLLKMK